jgi:hypothetical protein
VTLAEAKICTFTLESTHFIFNKCPIYTHDGASAKFRTNSQETDYRVPFKLEQYTHPAKRDTEKEAYRNNNPVQREDRIQRPNSWT